MSNVLPGQSPPTVKMAARVIDVHKDYVLKGGITVRALQGVSIDFPEGDFVAIMGTSG